MLRTISRAARRLDLWLQKTLGRPYNVLLTVGLVIEIARRLSELPDQFRTAQGLAAIVLPVVMEAALLIHQVGELSHHFRRRSGQPRREGRRRGHSTPA